MKSDPQLHQVKQENKPWLPVKQEQPKNDLKLKIEQKPFSGGNNVSSKQSSLFSPPSDSEQTSPFSLMVHADAKKERPVKIEDRKPIPVFKIDSRSNFPPVILSDKHGDGSREKKHKEKKKKKDKKREREKEPFELAPKAAENGELHVKKHKHKHKERSKDRERDNKEVLNASTAGLKLKIKTTQTTASVATHPHPPIAPLKINLSRSGNDSSSSSMSDVRKRPRLQSDTSSEGSASGIGNNPKMSRLLAPPMEAEHPIFNSAASGNHLSSKSSKKVFIY